MEIELVQRAGVSLKTIPAAGLHGVGVRELPGNTMQLVRGYIESRRIMADFQPDVLFFTGGYIAVPMALAGRRCASLLYVPDIEPGMALKTIARYAHEIAITTEESRAYYPNQTNTLVTGYPTRPGLKDWELEDARLSLGLTADLPALLVFGGSKGARSINRALLPCLADLLDEMQVIHITGRLDWDEVALTSDQMKPEHKARYRAFPYLHERMGAALRAADLVLSRAGASTLGEFPCFGLPAILVPYPHAWRYQQVNARYLADRGAAIIIEDQTLPEQLLPQVRTLIRDHKRREDMSRAMSSLDTPHAAGRIADLLLELAAGTHEKRI
jgi:UDP-N-acetylglucosamine--N-acetylmuramyl-(pentapeptide) pyrophosphoryl-undecaprenol N-acetylglucosamine transferase